MGAACISGIGMTFCFTALSVLGIQDVEPANYGVASSLGTTSYFLGAGLGLSFLTLISQFFFRICSRSFKYNHSGMLCTSGGRDVIL